MKLAIAFAMITTGAAAQGCPTAADLDAGIRLTRVDPLFSAVFTRTTNGLNEARVTQRGAQPEDVSTTYAHALAVSVRHAGNGTLSVDYAADTTELDNLPTLRSWESAITLRQNDADIGKGTYTANLTGFGQAMIGPCAYDVWRVNDVLRLDSGTIIRFEKSYAPDLGLIIGSIQLDSAGEPTGAVFFDEISVE